MNESLPPVDVDLRDVEPEQKPSPRQISDEAPHRISISPADLEVLRRLAPLTAAALADSKPPDSRSMRVAKKTVGVGRYAAHITGSFALASEVLRLWHPEYVSVVSAIARFVLQFVNTP